MDAEEKALLTESLDRLLQQTPAEDIDAALADFGWRDLFDDEPAAAVGILFELQGRCLAGTSSLDAAVSAAAGVNAVVLFPTLGFATPSSRVEKSGGQLLLRVEGVAKTRPAAPSRVLVPAVYDDATVLVHTGWPGSWPSAGTGVSPESGWARATGEITVAESELIGDAAAWARVRAAGHRALAHELTGLAGSMLSLAVDHVGSRTQFGKLLGGFQAVKHQLADVRLAQECAKLAAEAAWEPQDDSEAVAAALVAKAAANRFSHAARRNCQQVLGGMGFTWEHDFHRYLKRSLLLETLLGTTETLHAELGGRLRAGSLPRLAML
ncbi:MAG TPA: acyl-CoA dehydrogenase family protein [Kribbella sp.]|nr:acyl-CoA dehydrogenase family protein [Amycolatopsis sp.]HWD77327.1 acyl-CoA dehydrogenase family protein [Kribbella sp.]